MAHAGSNASDTQDRINRRVYHAKSAVREYNRATLTRAETMTLLKYQSAFAGRDVLDLGVGAGRTTIYLAPLARHYEAIDYSPVMVEAMQRMRPDISTRLSDVRDLSAFADDSFDFVFGSNNVLDAISHERRQQALEEIRRVLRPGGTFVFSAHNRRVREDLRTPTMTWSRNPINTAWQAMVWLRQMWNNMAMRKLHCEEDEFALYTDEGHHFACLHYYIDQQTQRRQLAQHGFGTLEVLDNEGRTLQQEDEGIDSGWLMYVATLRTKANGNTACG